MAKTMANGELIEENNGVVKISWLKENGGDNRLAKMK
jgi:hypothetical protein